MSDLIVAQTLTDSQTLTFLVIVSTIVMSMLLGTLLLLHNSRTYVRVVFSTFWPLGLVAFGGPQAHVAILRDHLVDQRDWLDEEQFTELFAIGQVRACACACKSRRQRGVHRSIGRLINERIICVMYFGQICSHDFPPRIHTSS